MMIVFKPKKFLILLLCLFLSAPALATSKKSVDSNDHYAFAIFSDTHLGSNKIMDLAPTSTDKSNDMDLKTFQMMMPRLQEALSSSEYVLGEIIVLGDLINHYTSSPFGSISERIDILKTHFQTLLEIEKKSGIPIAFVPGNNDSLSGNYQSFYNPDIAMHSAKEIAQNAHWEGFLSSKKSCGIDQNQYSCLLSEDRNGYYIEPLAPNLSLVVLNTVYFSARRNCDELCHNEINWLQEQLKKIKGTFIIAAHIPPGIDTHSGTLFWNEEAQRLLLKILTPFAGQLAAFFVSHTHMEELSFVQFKNQEPIPVVYTASLSTSHGNAPSFKIVDLVFDVSGQRWRLANFKTYHFKSDRFQPYYYAKTVYCITKESTSLLSDCLTNYVNTNKLAELQILINHHLTAGNENHDDMQRVSAEKLVTYLN